MGRTLEDHRAGYSTFQTVPSAWLADHKELGVFSSLSNNIKDDIVENWEEGYEKTFLMF